MDLCSFSYISASVPPSIVNYFYIESVNCKPVCCLFSASNGCVVRLVPRSHDKMFLLDNAETFVPEVKIFISIGG
jgi:hypothetical protein